jgi:hypothetical protein
LLGTVLRTAEDAWIAADFPADQISIDRILDNTIAAAK